MTKSEMPHCMVTRCGGSVKSAAFWFMLERCAPTEPARSTSVQPIGKRLVNEQLAAGLFWLSMLIPFGIFARQWLQLRRGAQRRGRATVLFFLYSLLPALSCAGFFLLLIGVEELTAHPLVGESFSRMLLPLVLISIAEAIILTLVFGVLARLLRTPDHT